MSAGKDSAPKRFKQPRVAFALAIGLVGCLGGQVGCASLINRNPNYYQEGGGSAWIPGSSSQPRTYSSLPSHAPISPSMTPNSEVAAAPNRGGLFGRRKRGATRGPSEPYPSYPGDSGALAQAGPRSSGSPTPTPIRVPVAGDPKPFGDKNVAMADNRLASPPNANVIDSPPRPESASRPEVELLPDFAESDPPSPPLAQAPPLSESERQDDTALPPPSPPPSPSSSSSPPPPPTESDGVSKAMALAETGQERLASIGNYQLSMTRQERVGDRLLPEETLTLSIRRAPRAIRMEWTSGGNEGREVIYDPQKFGGKLQVRVSKNGLLPTMSISADNAMIKKSSRHPISDAGLEGVANRVETAASRYAARDPEVGKLSYEGPVTIDDGFSQILGQLVKHVLPNGEVWLVVFDDQNGLPVLVEGKTATGDLLERYQFRDIRFDLPELASDDAFDPDKRWGRGGLFRRLTGGGGDTKKGTRGKDSEESEEQETPPVVGSRIKDDPVKPASAEGIKPPKSPQD